MNAPESQVEGSNQLAVPPLKLALVIHALHGGGAERLMSQLANRWCQAGHQVHVITLAATSTDQYRVDSAVTRHGLDLLSPSLSRWSALKANWHRVACLRRKLRQVQPDQVISFCDRTNILAITSALPLVGPQSIGPQSIGPQPMSLWIAEHSDPQRQVLGVLWETWRQWSYRALARLKSGGCVVLTPAIAQHMATRFPGLPLRVIPPAITLPEAAPAATGDANAGSKRQLTFLGRLSPEKNLPQLLQAWQQLASGFPDWHLVIAGDGPERRQLETLIHHRSLPRVELPGWIDDPRPLLAASDLFVLPSIYEGFPVALLEALGSGVACVSTPCSSALPELAAAQGLVVCPGTDAASIAGTLAKLMADRPRRAALAAAGRCLASHYTWPQVGRQWDQLLLSTLKLRGIGQATPQAAVKRR